MSIGKSMRNTLMFLAIGGAFVFFVATEEMRSTRASLVETPIAPDWAAIAEWPSAQVERVAAQPDPNRRITVIVLDDSGSMGSDIDAAKAAVIDALDAMQADDRVAVVALNAGVVAPFASVADARRQLPLALAPILSDGGTPLTEAVRWAEQALDSEAAAARGFGTFRLIVTTDGAANNAAALRHEIEGLAARTPIQLTTIGIGIRGAHVLRRSDIGSFVDLADIGALPAALRAAVAENASFTAITDFTESEG